MTTPDSDRPADRVGEQVDTTTDQKSSDVASKEELERAVSEKTALVRDLAESDPNVSEAAPTRKAAAKMAPAAKKAPATKKAPAKRASKKAAAANSGPTPAVAVPSAPAA